MKSAAIFATIAVLVAAMDSTPAAAYDPDRDGGGYNGKRDYQYNGVRRGYDRGYYQDGDWQGRDKRCDVVMRNGQEVRRCW